MGLERRRGDAIVHGERVLVPISTVFSVHGRRGGLVWSRAREVVVTDGEGTRRIRVPDPTRRAQYALLAAGAIAALLVRKLARRRR